MIARAPAATAGDEAAIADLNETVALQRIAVGTQAMTIYKPLRTLASGAAELAVHFPPQVIDPDVHKLLEEGPTRRRRFLDWGVFHVEPKFLEHWRRYQRSLRQRNAALRTEAADAVVQAWDPELRTAEGMAEFNAVMTFSGGPSVTPYLEAINNFVFGEMWNRRKLDERSRRWLTLVGVAESRAEVPIKSHFHAGMASGNCTQAEMLEFSLQYGLHAGWPRASLVNGIIMQMAQKIEAGLPWNG